MNENDSSMGQDSFLDVVANLVGIMIILVVVVGAQAATVWKKPGEPAEEIVDKIAELNQQANQKLAASKNLRTENGELHRKIAEEQSISNQLSEFRQVLLMNIETARRDVEARKSRLDEVHRVSVIAAAEIESLKQKIEQVRFQTQAIENQAKPIVETIEHYPTPIARTVFSDEIHFRILAGRIVHVPLEELITVMKKEWELKAEKLQGAENTLETVGPIGDFRLQYALETATRNVQNRQQLTAQLKQFVLQPTAEKIGENVDTALGNGSQFRNRIDRMIPEKTTVSLWVYPDAYDDLATIRRWLIDAGFQTASWPLEYGKLISGGPQGFRTTTN